MRCSLVLQNLFIPTPHLSARSLLIGMNQTGVNIMMMGQRVVHGGLLTAMRNGVNGTLIGVGNTTEVFSLL